MTTKGTLGIDYVTIQGRGQRDQFNGALVLGDEFMHLGIIKPMGGSETACHQPINQFLLTNEDVDINCPKCVAVLTKRAAESDV